MRPATIVDALGPSIPVRRMARRRYLLACPLITLLYGASSAPSPLYGVYQDRWHFGDGVLTGIFAVYSVTVVVALLFLGPLSDRYGRRKLATAGLVTVGTSMVAFALAPNVEWLVAARAIQGMGVGVAGAALTAAVVDSRPDDPGLGAMRAAVCSDLGLGVGVLGAGLLVAYTRDPTSRVFVALVVLICALLPASVALPSGAGLHPDQERGRTALGVTSDRRRDFLVHGVGLAVAWAVGGLYLSLGPSIAAVITRSSGRVSETVAVSALGLVGGLATWLGGRWEPATQVRVGSPLLVAGLAIVVWSCLDRSGAWFLVGSVVLGAGWGLLNVGSFRALVGLSGPGNRAGVISVAYLISYGAFSIPTLAAGLAVAAYGLRLITVVFGATAALGAAAAWGLGIRSGAGTFGHLLDENAVRGRDPRMTRAARR